MNEFFEKNRKACIIGGTLIFAAVFAFYLFALFRPGYWHREVFLYKEKAPFEGMSVFSGHDAVNKADYELTMACSFAQPCPTRTASFLVFLMRKELLS